MAQLKVLVGVDNNNQRLINLADPSVGTDATTKQYVDNLLAGLRWKQSVRVATTTAGTLASSFENGDTIDGVVLATNDRILIKDQAAGQENGIWVVQASGTPVRATDSDSTSELENATVFVSLGTVNADKAYTQTATVTAVGTTPQTWVAFGAGTAYTADGNGIELSGTVFALELDGTSLSKTATGVKVNNAFVTALAGAGLTETSQVLAVGQGTGITVAADTVGIDTSIVVRKFSQDIGNGVLTAIPVTHSLGTKDVQVTMRENATDTVVMTEWVATSTTVVTLNFPSAPTTAQYRVTVEA